MLHSEPFTTGMPYQTAAQTPLSDIGTVFLYYMQINGSIAHYEHSSKRKVFGER